MPSRVGPAPDADPVRAPSPGAYSAPTSATTATHTAAAAAYLAHTDPPTPVMTPHDAPAVERRADVQGPSSTCRILLSLLCAVLSLSPPFEVAIHIPPSGAGSTVRSRPYVPLKNVWKFVSELPLITAR